MSKVAIVTLGCPKNAIDSEGIGGLLGAGGHDIVEDPDSAEVVVVNTCGFIDPARRETVQEVLDLAELKDAGDLKGLVLTGCLVARSADEIAAEIPEVDALVDFAAYPRVSEIVTRVAQGTLDEKIQGEPGTRFDPAWWDAAIAASPRLRFGRTPWAYLKIAEGCDRGCTFCAIPLMRGKFRSRSIDTVVTEARHLVASGVTELSLVSQDSVMWGRDTAEGNLADLLRSLDGVDGLKRVRLMYLHPQGLTDELIDTMCSSDIVVPYFDLSLQHVAPTVLRRMGRWGGRDRFLSIIDRVRRHDPLAAVRMTFILGFPGESDDDAREVVNFIDEAEADWIGVFTYSREVGTRSHDLDDQVEPVIARQRTQEAMSAAEAAMDGRAASLVGRTFKVLVERLDLDDGCWSGRSHREAPEIDGEIRFSTSGTVRVGDYVDVYITGTEGLDLVGVHENGA
jgi:ribosomal protein S12 methylthiotransferase